MRESLTNSFFLQSCQHSSTDNSQTLCRSGVEGSADKVFVSDDKRFVSTLYYTDLPHTAMQEIDFIEEGNGQLTAYEFKWNPKRIPKVPKTFTNNYPNATFKVITRDNVEEFLL